MYNVEENLLFSTLILGSVFNDYVVFYGDVYSCAITVKLLQKIQWITCHHADGFLSSHIVQNLISAEAPPRNLLGSLQRSPDPIVSWKGNIPFPFSTPGRFWHLAFDAIAAVGTEKRRMEVPHKPYFWIRPSMWQVKPITSHMFAQTTNVVTAPHGFALWSYSW